MKMEVQDTASSPSTDSLQMEYQPLVSDATQGTLELDVIIGRRRNIEHHAALLREE